MRDDFNPLTEDAPEVALPAAPLATVVAQVRFPLIAAIEAPDKVAPFQEAIRDVFPDAGTEQQTTVAPVAGLLRPTDTKRVWMFTSADGVWQATLSRDSLALQTSRYTSRADFLGRFDSLVRVLAGTFAPAHATRVGIRYVDRLTGIALSEVDRLVKPRVAGLVGTMLGAQASHSVGDCLLQLTPSPGLVRARWGRLPAMGQFDQSAVDPIDEPTWLLDIDAFNPQPQPFSPEVIFEDMARLATRSYAFFRWSVTDEFLIFHGGVP